MKHILSAFLILVLLTQTVVAQDGSVDLTFNATTPQITANTNFNNTVWDSHVYSNGEYLVCGAFTALNGQPANRIIKLDQQGNSVAGFANGSGPDSTINGALILMNGQILVHGLFSTYDNSAAPGIALLNADGSRDLGFQLVNPFIEITATMELSDGRILVGGYLDNSGHSRIIRIMTDGSIDPTFGVDVQPAIAKLTTDASGAIYACGDFTTIGGVARTKVAKLSSEGIVDPGYTIPVAYTDGTQDILVHPDGTLVLSCFANVGGQYGHFRFLPNGTPDPSFTGASGWARYLQVERDAQGKYWFLVTNNQFYWVKRLNNDGTTDNSYKSQQFTAGSFKTHMTPEPNGNVLVGGYPGSLGGLQRLATDGRIDASFMPSKGFSRPVNVVKTLPDGKTLVGGNFYGVNGESYNGIVRLLNNGAIDMSFDCGTGAVNFYDDQSENFVNAIEVQPDGKILVGGNFDSFNGYSYKKLVRLLANGSVDTSFHIGSGFNDAVKTILVQPDGRIIVGGTFLFYDQFGANSAAAYGCIRLQSNGLPDPTFQSNTMNGSVNTIQLLPNGQLLLGGSISSYNGQTVKNLIRVNQTGQLDNTFTNAAFQAGSIYDIALQEDGNYLIGTGMSNYLGVYQPTLYRLLPNGSIDNTFVPQGMTPEIDCREIALQPDGKILVLATAEAYQTHFTIFRLLPTGQQDLSFNLLDYADANLTLAGINSFDLQPDGRIVAGGQFITCNGYLSNNLVRLSNSIASTNCQFFGVHIQSVSTISCGGGNAQIKAFAQNGAAPYSYSWDNAPLVVDDTVFTTGSAGIHYLTVADTAGCTYSTGYLINGPLSQIDDRVLLITAAFRPGFTYGTTLEVLNDGCPLSSGTLTLIKDPLITLQSSNPAPVSVSGDTLTWNYQDLAFDSTHFVVHLLFETSTSAVIGDQIHLIATADSQGTDSDTTNNVFAGSFPVINGYDPNDKKVYPTGECLPGYIHQGDELIYTVRFQNTGNSEAINVSILDSINPYLDIHSLRILGSSHTMYTEVLSGSSVRFVFNNIQLPDSTTDENGSQGYVVYAINQQPYLFEESEIRNKAAIFFDFNPPIITNEVLNTIIDHDPNVTGDTLLAIADDSYLWEGTTYTETGIYASHYSTPELCDSSVFLNLTITHNSYSTITVAACESWPSPSGEQIWTISGTYTDTIANAYGADSIITVNLAITTLNTNTSLIDELTISSLETNATTYQWLDCVDGFSLIPGATSSIFTALANGNYAVEVTANGCVDTSACVSIVSVGVHSFDDLKSVSVAPNPTTGSLHVEIQQPFQRASWKLTQLSGSVLQTGNSSVTNFDLFIEGNPGMYFLWLELDSGEVIRVPIVRL